MFYKEKGFYISLLCGVVALIAFGAICFNLMGRDGTEGDVPRQVAEKTMVPRRNQRRRRFPATKRSQK